MKVKIEVSFFGTPESFELACTSLEAAIYAVKEKESNMIHKPSCYSSPAPYLKKVLKLYQDILDRSKQLQKGKENA